MWRRSRNLEGDLRAMRPAPRQEFLGKMAEKAACGSGRSRAGRLRPLIASAMVVGLIFAVAILGGFTSAANIVRHPSKISPFEAAACTYGPMVTSITPNHESKNHSYTGLVIIGMGFSCTTNGVSIDLGSGVTVSNIVVTGDTKITFDISIAAGASKSTRDVNVTTSSGTGTLPNGFTVTQ